MSTRQLVLRLCWKEWREDWPVLLVGVALPIAFLFSRHKHNDLIYAAISLVSILVTLWSVERARQREQARNLLPLPATLQWIFLLFIPVIVPLLIGIVMGYAIVHTHMANGQPEQVINTMILFMLANFVMSAFLSLVISPIPAIIAGVLLLFFGCDVVTITSYQGIFQVVLGVSLFGFLVLGISRRKVWTLAVMAVVLLVPASIVLSQQLRSQNSPGQTVLNITPLDYWQNDITYQDGSAEIRSSFNPSFKPPKYSPLWKLSAGGDTRLFRDLRENREQLLTFSPIVRTLCFLDRTHGLFAQQKPGSKQIHLLEWALGATAPSEVATFTTGENAHRLCYFAQASPDKRYLVLVLGSQINEGNDLWMVDLHSGSVKLVLPDIVENPGMQSNGIHCAWTPDHLLLSGDGMPVEVNLRDMQARRLARVGR